MQTLSQFFSQIPVLYKTAALLLLSNCFMTFAWYAHLKNLGSSPLWVAVISSWLIAFLGDLRLPKRIGSFAVSF